MEDGSEKTLLANGDENGDIITPVLRRRKIPLRKRILYRIEDFVDDISWRHVLFKVFAYSYFLFLAVIAFQVMPFPGHWARSTQPHKFPIIYQNLEHYFNKYEGFAQCGLKVTDVYTPPVRNEDGHFTNGGYCSRRAQLLEAMSNGGRVGFDAPYTCAGCQYRWYTADEICMILDRFDAVVFIGDASLQNIYNGFNILLRQDLATGALKSWELDRQILESCRCEAQFDTPACAEYFITSSEQVNENTPSIGSSYTCSRFPHAILHVDGSPSAAETQERFKNLVPRVSRSNYHPVPIIHSLSPGSVGSVDEASKSLLEFLSLADASKRKTPMLWVGPTAAGHIEIKGRKGNQEIWDYDRAMAETAMKNDIEVLNMWNLTVQATSFDGIGFGEKVAITQAMMVVNWLSRLESS